MPSRIQWVLLHINRPWIECNASTWKWTYPCLRKNWKCVQRKGHFTAWHVSPGFHNLFVAGSHTSIMKELVPFHQHLFYRPRKRVSIELRHFRKMLQKVGSSSRHMTSVPAVTWSLDKNSCIWRSGGIIRMSNRGPMWWHHCLTAWEFALDSLPTSRKPGLKPPSRIPTACYYRTSTILL